MENVENTENFGNDRENDFNKKEVENGNDEVFSERDKEFLEFALTGKQKTANNVNVILFQRVDLGEIRVIGDFGNPLFCLSDVCKILEHTNASMVKEAILKEFEIPKLDLVVLESTNNRTLEANFINEAQLYFVLMRSDKPKAKIFRKWITQEVIPSIRKTGGYGYFNSENERFRDISKEMEQKLWDMQQKVEKALENMIEQKQKENEILIEISKERAREQKEYNDFVIKTNEFLKEMLESQGKAVNKEIKTGTPYYKKPNNKSERYLDEIKKLVKSTASIDEVKISEIWAFLYRDFIAKYNIKGKLTMTFIRSKEEYLKYMYSVILNRFNESLKAQTERNSNFVTNRDVDELCKIDDE